MKVAIIGCGLIGQKRANALGSAQLVACVDKNISNAQTLADDFSEVDVTDDWRQIMGRPDIDIIFIATPHHLLAEITGAAVRAHHHVLVEKPAARFTKELDPIIEVAKQSPSLVRVGFNHRYHPAIRKAHEIFTTGALGKMMFVCGRYGHGGRLGYEKEWRANPKISGGGELIDQGTHLIDLARLFLGNFSDISGFAHTYFWPMPVDDNAFMLLRTDQKQAASLHVSCTEWKNLFSLEIYGAQAKLHIEGLGGSYGLEQLSYYKMLPEMGPPETSIWEYPGKDNSWEIEFKEFLEDIHLKRTPSPGLSDAYAALEVVEKVYAQSGYFFSP
ncbi:MAG: gfo/Idh/MocA family oxidoreductase [Kiritimatiellae bacterium]|nr:gfo/Idh/MocA family oxidoreductase [Kiritimatiellia bacterium]